MRKKIFRLLMIFLFLTLTIFVNLPKEALALGQILGCIPEEVCFSVSCTEYNQDDPPSCNDCRYTNRNEGDSCGPGMYCSSGSCVSGTPPPPPGGACTDNSGCNDRPCYTGFCVCGADDPNQGDCLGDGYCAYTLQPGCTPGGQASCIGEGTECNCPDDINKGTCTNSLCEGCPEVVITSLDQWLAANPCPDEKLCADVARIVEGEFNSVVDNDRKKIDTGSSPIISKVEVPNEMQPEDYCKKEGLYQIILREGKHGYITAGGAGDNANTIMQCDAVNIDWDTVEFCNEACTSKPVMWVPEAPKGGQCCGDDDEWACFDMAAEAFIDCKTADDTDPNLFVLVPDDPDWSEAACKECVTFAQLPGEDRVWDPEHGCCGDDEDDFVDVSEIFCTQCKKGRHKDEPSLRIWEPSAGKDGQCCGNGDSGFLNEDQTKYHKGDDPDMGPIACTRCDFGDNADNPSIRIWDPIVKQCCGDDVNGSSLPIEEQNQSSDNKWETILDDADWSETTCSQCPVGMNQDDREYAEEIVGNGCCGDDPEDCAFISGAWLCKMDLNNTDPKWYTTNPTQAGEIVHMGCNDMEYLGKKDSWEICDSFWIKKVLDHEYLCAEKTASSGACSSESCLCCQEQQGCEEASCMWQTFQSKCKPSTCESLWTELGQNGEPYCSSTSICPDTHPYVLGKTEDCGMCCGSLVGKSSCGPDTETKNFIINECAGDDARYSSSGGEAYTTGQSLIMGNETYYCSINATWIKTLDNDPDTCEAAGFTWTGNYCCGESENEYYNDTRKGCWNSVVVGNNTLVTNNTNPSNPEILFIDGSYEGCKASQEILDLKNDHTSEELVINNLDCSIFGPWFCSYLGRWNRTLGLNKTHLNQIAWQNESAQIAECCQPSECWRGNQCVLNQAPKPTSLPHYMNYRCIDGNWKNSTLKFDWNEEKSGYCPNGDMCLVNPEGKYENNGNTSRYVYEKKDDPSSSTNPQCINKSQFILDHFCEMGNWTTRTKLLALQLLNFAEYSKLNYDLDCDLYLRAVNKFDYSYLGNNMLDLLARDNCMNFKVPCANKLCVLRYNLGKNTVFGTALNQVPADNDFSFLYIIGKNQDNPDEKDYCKNALDETENKYYQCKNADVWYNPITQSIIYSKSAIDIPSGSSFDQIKAYFNDIVFYIKTIWNPEYKGINTKINLNFLNESKNFDRLYLALNKNKNIQGIIEKIKNDKYLSLKYSGFDADICKSVDLYNIREPGFDVYPPSSRKGSDEIVCTKSQENNSYYVFSKKQTTSWIGESAWDDLTVKTRVK